METWWSEKWFASGRLFWRQEIFTHLKYLNYLALGKPKSWASLTFLCSLTYQVSESKSVWCHGYNNPKDFNWVNFSSYEHIIVVILRKPMYFKLIFVSTVTSRITLMLVPFIIVRHFGFDSGNTADSSDNNASFFNINQQYSDPKLYSELAAQYYVNKTGKYQAEKDAAALKFSRSLDEWSYQYCGISITSINLQKLDKYDSRCNESSYHAISPSDIRCHRSCRLHIPEENTCEFPQHE